jgi:hypothetical protein
MRVGGGRDKGFGFEIQIAKRLSKWITGDDKDPIFWRSAGSGSFGKITTITNLRGDIMSIKEAGNPLMDKISIEVKCYKDIDLLGLIDGRSTTIPDWWRQCRDDAGDKIPLLIMKRNRGQAILVGRQCFLESNDLYSLVGRTYSIAIVIDEPLLFIPLETFLQHVSYNDFMTSYLTFSDK